MTTKQVLILYGGMWGSWIIHLFEKYLFDDWVFAAFFTVLVALDTITGIWKALKYRNFSSMGFGRLISKVAVYFIILCLAHNLRHYKIDGHENGFFQWADDFFYTALVVKEAISLLENLGAINKSLVPLWILKRLKEFDQTGDYTKIKPQAPDQHEPKPEVQ